MTTARHYTIKTYQLQEKNNHIDEVKKTSEKTSNTITTKLQKQIRSRKF